jgi:hypothetical protein
MINRRQRFITPEKKKNAEMIHTQKGRFRLVGEAFGMMGDLGDPWRKPWFLPGGIGLFFMVFKTI